MFRKHLDSKRRENLRPNHLIATTTTKTASTRCTPTTGSSNTWGPMTCLSDKTTTAYPWPTTFVTCSGPTGSRPPSIVTSLTGKRAGRHFHCTLLDSTGKRSKYNQTTNLRGQRTFQPPPLPASSETRSARKTTVPSC